MISTAECLSTILDRTSLWWIFSTKRFVDEFEKFNVHECFVQYLMDATQKHLRKTNPLPTKSINVRKYWRHVLARLKNENITLYIVCDFEFKAFDYRNVIAFFALDIYLFSISVANAVNGQTCSRRAVRFKNNRKFTTNAIATKARVRRKKRRDNEGLAFSQNKP